MIIEREVIQINKQERLDLITEAKIKILSIGINNLTPLMEKWVDFYNHMYTKIENEG